MQLALARSLRLGNRNEQLLFLTGVNLMLLNFIVVQHIALAIRQAEIAVLVFSLAYFSGISLGYAVSDRIRLATVRKLLPAFLLAQLLLIVFVQSFHYVVSSDISRWAEERGLSSDLGDWVAAVVIFAFIAFGVTSLHSVFLPKIIDDEGGDLRRSYSVEVAGSLVGLLLVPILAGFSHTLLLAGYLLSFLAVTVVLRASRVLVLVVAFLMVVFLRNAAAWDQETSGWFYTRYYGTDVREVLYTKYTPYHKIEVLDLGGGESMLVLNGKRQFASGSHYIYSYYVAEYPARLFDSKSVCLLGCGSMSTVGRIGDLVDSIKIVDLDPEVFATSKRFFPKYNRLGELSNWTFTPDDAKHFVASTEERFDLVLHDIPPAKSRQIALTYTEEFFEHVKDRLNPGGVFSIASLTPFSSTSRYGKRLIATLGRVFEHCFILQYRSAVYFFGSNGEISDISRDEMIEAIDHRGKNKVKVYIGDEVREIVKGESIITINNVGDLIYE